MASTAPQGTGPQWDCAHKSSIHGRAPAASADPGAARQLGEHLWEALFKSKIKYFFRTILRPATRHPPPFFFLSPDFIPHLRRRMRRGDRIRCLPRRSVGTTGSLLPSDGGSRKTQIRRKLDPTSPHEALWTLILNEGWVLPVFLLASVGIGATGPDLGPKESTQINFYRSEIACPPNHDVSNCPSVFQSLRHWSGDNP